MQMHGAERFIEGIVRILKASATETDTQNYRILNIGNGKPVNLLEFIQTLEETFGHQVEKIMLPMQDGDVPQTWADTSSLGTITHYSPQINLKEGISYFGQWVKRFYNIQLSSEQEI